MLSSIHIFSLNFPPGLMQITGELSWWFGARASASNILSPFCMHKEKHNVWQRVTLFDYIHSTDP